MNQQEILQKVQEYATQNNIANFKIYCENRRYKQYEDILTLDNLSSILVGGSLLAAQELIIPLLPFMEFKCSSHCLRIVSTYSQYLFDNKDVMINLIKNNQSLFKFFSTNNKQIYFYSENILKERVSEILDIFKEVLNKKGSLIEKKPSISYGIDLNELINLINIKSFHWIESNLINLLDGINFNKDVFNYLEIEKTSCEKNNEITVVINFVGSYKENLIDSFMNALIKNFIEFENSYRNNDKNESIKEKINKLLNFTLIQEQLVLKDELKIKKMKI